MQKTKRFLSLKWKLAFNVGLIIISLYSAYTYYVYQQATTNFSNSRIATQRNQINIAQALTEESFFVLDRFVESILLVPGEQQNIEQALLQIFNKNWQHWQVIWGLENVVYYNQQGYVVQSWGGDVGATHELILRTMSLELPQHQIVCKQGCFQQVLTPVLSGSQVVGVVSVSLALADTLLLYKQAMQSDIGVLISHESHMLSAVTQAQTNNELWSKVIKKYTPNSFMNSALIFNDANRRYELRAFSINKNELAPPYYVIINDVSDAYENMHKKLLSLSVIGLAGLLLIILVLLLNIHFRLTRVRQLSQALPLLVKHQYIDFRQKLKKQKQTVFSDEMTQLSETAADVAWQLKALGDNATKNTELLLKQSQELGQERDFVARLINTAPILIITQNLQGEIISINKKGQSGLNVSVDKIIGMPFANLIVETEQLQKLEQLRANSSFTEVSFDSRLGGLTDDPVYISWIHTVLRGKNNQQETIILSLGVDITERHVADEQLIWLATHDQLTGLGNRRHFQKELDNMLATAGRYKEQVALYYLDLDQFKIINDTDGHQAGDELLQVITSVLKKEVRETDLLCRIGGDEFTLVIPSAEIDGINILSNKLLHALTKIQYTIDDQPHPISFSIGVAIYPQHGSTQQDLLANADLAMYQAKKTGRSRCHIYSPEVEYQAVLTKQLHWKRIIEGAIKNDEFVLYYQPILDIKNKVISHYECLLRIIQKDGKMLMPGDFIPQAENIGIIDQIDHLVLRKAIDQHLAFQAIGNNSKLAINLSGRSMNEIDTLPVITKLLDEPGVKPELIIFEITETSAVSNFLSAKTMIKQLKSLGCHFALDDFGVGFSSFYYLKSLPVDYVKIDGSFVKQMDVSEEDKIFVKVLTEVSQAFGKKIIAEFVENEAILGLLEQQGVDYAQGYYVSKPIPDPLDLSHVKGLK